MYRLFMASVAAVISFTASTVHAGLFQYQTSFGSPTLSSPWGGTRDAAGNFYVAEYSASSTIAVFDASHAFTGRFGAGTLGWAVNLAAAPNGCLYVLDNGTVRKFDASHASVATFGTLNSAFGIATDTASNVYIADTGNNRLLKFDANGNALLTITPTGSGAFNHPYGITVDATGQIYVADTFNNRVQEFAPDGSFLRQFSTTIPAWPYDHPAELAVDSTGRIFVSEDSGLVAFSSTGDLLDYYGSGGTFAIPTSVMTDDSTLWCVDRSPSTSSTTHNLIQVFAVPEPASLALLAIGLPLLLKRR